MLTGQGARTAPMKGNGMTQTIRRHRWTLTAILTLMFLVFGTAASANAQSWRWSSWGRHAGHTFGSYEMRNNEWNDSAGPQKIMANSIRRWQVWSKQSGTAVKTYPDVQHVFSTVRDHPRPVGSFRSLWSRFHATLPGARNGDYEFAYDIWMGENWQYEIMIWTDTVRQVPAGTHRRNTNLYGVAYQVWVDNGGGDHIYTLKRIHNARSGTTHILDSIRRLHSLGYLPDRAMRQGFRDVEFGPEVCATRAGGRTFNVYNYELGWRNR